MSFPSRSAPCRSALCRFAGAAALALMTATVAQAQGGGAVFERLRHSVRQHAFQDLDRAQAELLALLRKGAPATRYGVVLAKILEAESRLVSAGVSLDDQRLLSSQLPEGVAARRAGAALAYRLLLRRVRLEAAPEVGDLRTTFEGRGAWVVHKATGRRGHVALSP